MTIILAPNSEWKVTKSDNWNYELIHTYISTGVGKNKDEMEEPRIVNKSLGFFCRPEDAIERWIHETIADRCDDFNGTLSEYVKKIEQIKADLLEQKVKVIKDGK